MMNKDSDPTTPFKLKTCTNNLVSHLRVLFCPCVVRKAMAHVDRKASNMRPQAQKRFRGIFIRIQQHQKWYLVYVPSKRKIISSYDMIFDKICSNTLAYTP